MGWEIEFTDEFETWWNDLSEDEQEEIDAKVDLLEERGPGLHRPHADRIESSRHANMKELRGKIQERHLRVLFAFDPRRTALLLLGGDKTDDPKWYDKFVPIADSLFDQHLKKLNRNDERRSRQHENESEEQRMMRMAKNFNTLREKMSPESRERSRNLAAKYRAEMPLDELREAREMTQVLLARILKVNQAAVSKMERRTDMYVSTLQELIKAMGGELKITASFPDGTVEINQFQNVKKTEQKSSSSAQKAAAGAVGVHG